MDVKKIGIELERTHQAIRSKASRLRLKQKRLSSISDFYAKTTLAYLAGIIDADGCICILKTKPNQHNRKGKWSLRLNVTNTNSRLVGWLTQHFPDIGHLFWKFEKEGWKPRYDWYLSGWNAAKLLELCLSYLVIKKEQAKIAIEFQETFGKEKRKYYRLPESVITIRESLRIKMSELNQVGKDHARKRKG